MAKINNDAPLRNASPTIPKKVNKHLKEEEEAMHKPTKSTRRTKRIMDKPKARGVEDVAMSRVADKTRAKLKTYSEMQ